MPGMATSVAAMARMPRRRSRATLVRRRVRRRNEAPCRAKPAGSPGSPHDCALGRPARHASCWPSSVIVVWAVTGPMFGYSDTWQLVINTGTTIVTFLMVFLIQNTQNRDSLAFQIKLDELIIKMHGARQQDRGRGGPVRRGPRGAARGIPAARRRDARSAGAGAARRERAHGSFPTYNTVVETTYNIADTESARISHYPNTSRAPHAVAHNVPTAF